MTDTMIDQTAKRLREGSVTSRMLTEEALSRIREHASMGAFITVCEEEALRMAEEADRDPGMESAVEIWEEKANQIRLYSGAGF